MGGFYSAVADFASKGLDKLASNDTGAKLIDFAGTRAMERARTPQGQLVAKYMDLYKSESAKALQGLDSSHRTLTEGIQKDSALRNAFSLDKTPLRDITNHLTRVNHPLAPVASRLEAQTSGNFERTLKDIHTSNMAQAHLIGIQQSLGKNFENLVGPIMELQEHPDPRMLTHANRLLEGVSSELKDTTSKFLPSGAKTQVSAVKDKVASALATVNKAREAMRRQGVSGVKMLLPKAIDTSPSYTKAGEVEKRVSNWIRMVQVPLVAIPHIGNYFNLGATAPLKAIGRALLSGNDTQVKQAVEASASLAATMHDIMHAFIEGKTGIVSKTPFLGPTAGDMLYKITHTPGFNYLREKQLWLGAATGYHAAIDWASQAAKGDKRAIAELTEMRLEVKGIVQRGGKLTPEELSQAIYHFTNNRFFMSRLQDQSLKSNSNLWMRSATMYHSFLNSQVSFMRREMDKMMKAGDITGIAQFVGTMGIVAPLTAPFIKSLEVLGRTGNPGTAVQSVKDDYSKLGGSKGITPAMVEYLDLVAHSSGIGVFMNYMNAAQNHRLQAAFAGPVISTPLTLAEDTLSGALHTDKKGKHNFKPAVRDALQDSIPVLGKPLSHWLAPTTKEQPKVKLSRKGRRRF